MAAEVLAALLKSSKHPFVKSGYFSPLCVQGEMLFCGPRLVSSLEERCRGLQGEMETGTGLQRESSPLSPWACCLHSAVESKGGVMGAADRGDSGSFWDP